MHQNADDSRCSVHQQEFSLNDGQKSAKLKQILIILALISLLSRIVYTTYATWLTVNQFNCIPCVNSSSNSSSSTSEPSSSLFTSQHASFKLISKGFNSLNHQNEGVKVRDNQEAHVRVKRIAEFKMDKLLVEGLNVFEDVKGTQNETVDKEKNLTVKIDDKNYSQINDKNDNQLNERSKKSKILDSIREADKKPHEQLNKTNFNDELTKLRIYLSQKDSIDRSDQDDESKYQDGGSRLYVQGSDLNVQESDLNVQGSDKRLNVDLLSEETRSGRRFDDGNLKNGNFQYDKLTNSNSSSNDTVECSHECSAEQFLSFSVRVIDPHNRKWATIMITSLYYINSLVMLCLFLGVSFHFIDLLIVSSFIEGGKLFVCFVLLMIDIFNGVPVKFNLIDVKFDVDSQGRAWSLDVIYSESILDVILFTFTIIYLYKAMKSSSNKKLFGNQQGHSQPNSIEVHGNY